MAQAVVPSKTIYGSTQIEGSASAHLGDRIYGDTFQVAHVEHATFYLTGPPQDRSSDGVSYVAEVFTQTVKHTLEQVCLSR